MAESAKYIYNPEVKGLPFINGSSEKLLLPLSDLKDALTIANQKIEKIADTVPGLFKTLGMRNLSAFIGEVLVEAIEEASDGKFIRNPHQDGYPDLLAMTVEGKKAWENLKDSRDKSPFSPFPTGGIEVKSTCGSVPTPSQLEKKGLRKPDIGESRIDMMTSYDWKAHHRLTNNLLANVWDFVDGKPLIVALFYGGKLTEDSWGSIISPKKGGGRTTSVSIMTRDGVKQMYDGWVTVMDDDRYIEFFDKFNKSNSMSSVVRQVRASR